MSQSPSPHLANLGKSAVTGWLAMLVTFLGFSIWTWLSLGSKAVGLGGLILASGLFGAILSACYVLGFLFGAVPFYFLFICRLPQVRAWQWALVGGGLFLLGIPIWAFFTGRPPEGDIVFAYCMSFIAGFAAFLSLGRSVKGEDMARD